MRSVEIELWRDDPEAALNEEEADRDELDLRVRFYEIPGLQPNYG